MGAHWVPLEGVRIRSREAPPSELWLGSGKWEVKSPVQFLKITGVNFKTFLDDFGVSKVFSNTVNELFFLSFHMFPL